MITKKILPIIFFILIALATIFCFIVPLRNNQSALSQIKEIIFPSKYSKAQMQNLKEDLSTMVEQHEHEVLGREYGKTGNYEKAIEEYKKSIEIAQDDLWEPTRIDRQRFPRGRLREIYIKIGRHQEALEQIDWVFETSTVLFAKIPDHPFKIELLAWKDVINAEMNQNYEGAIKRIDEFLKASAQPSKYQQPQITIDEFLAKKIQLEEKLKTIPNKE